MPSPGPFSLIAVTAALLLGVALPGGAMAQSAQLENHPRRAEVNHRIELRNRRIQDRVDDGQVTTSQRAVTQPVDREKTVHALQVRDSVISQKGPSPLR